MTLFPNECQRWNHATESRLLKKSTEPTLLRNTQWSITDVYKNTKCFRKKYYLGDHNAVSQCYNVKV